MSFPDYISQRATLLQRLRCRFFGHDGKAFCWRCGAVLRQGNRRAPVAHPRPAEPVKQSRRGG